MDTENGIFDKIHKAVSGDPIRSSLSPACPLVLPSIAKFGLFEAWFVKCAICPTSHDSARVGWTTKLYEATLTMRGFRQT